MEYKALKRLRTDKQGDVAVGDSVELTKSQAEMYLEKGAVEEYETKVVTRKPKSQKAKKPAEKD